MDNTQVIQAGGDTATSEVPTSFCVVDFVLLKSGAVACCFHDIHKPELAFWTSEGTSVGTGFSALNNMRDRILWPVQNH